MQSHCEERAVEFIKNIWNKKELKMLDKYLHPAFKDYSLPMGFQNVRGLSLYLSKLNSGIIHQTTIESVVSIQQMVIIGIKIQICGLVEKLDINNHQTQVETICGHRILSFSDARIIGHWEVI